MDHSQTAPKNLKATGKQALVVFLFPIVLLFAVRWIVIEPFVIPSESMVPNLLVHDYILVKKFNYGLRIPFSDQFLIKWSGPERGDIVVFRYPQNPEVFYIKRLIGLPGDEIQISDGRITVNGQTWALDSYDTQNSDFPEPERFSYFLEKIPSPSSVSHVVRFYSEPDALKEAPAVIKVPEKSYFFMGDNRDQSADSRVWGFVDERYLIGPAWRVWLSCESTLASSSMICDPQFIRWARIFKKI